MTKRSEEFIAVDGDYLAIDRETCESTVSSLQIELTESRTNKTNANDDVICITDMPSPVDLKKTASSQDRTDGTDSHKIARVSNVSSQPSGVSDVTETHTICLAGPEEQPTDEKADDARTILLRNFYKQLQSVTSTRPPISRSRVQIITKAAISASTHYKHVVNAIEKFIRKCPLEHRLPVIYVIDSIVRQSRHVLGPTRDMFGPRFLRHMENIFQSMKECSSEDIRKLMRVISLWQRADVFPDDRMRFLATVVYSFHSGASSELTSRLIAGQMNPTIDLNAANRTSRTHVQTHDRSVVRPREGHKEADEDVQVFFESQKRTSRHPERSSPDMRIHARDDSEGTRLSTGSNARVVRNAKRRHEPHPQEQTHHTYSKSPKTDADVVVVEDFDARRRSSIDHLDRSRHSKRHTKVSDRKSRHRTSSSERISSTRKTGESRFDKHKIATENDPLNVQYQSKAHQDEVSSASSDNLKCQSHAAHLYPDINMTPYPVPISGTPQFAQMPFHQVAPNQNCASHFQGHPQFVRLYGPTGDTIMTFCPDPSSVDLSKPPPFLPLGFVNMPMRPPGVVDLNFRAAHPSNEERTFPSFHVNSESSGSVSIQTIVEPEYKHQPPPMPTSAADASACTSTTGKTDLDERKLASCYHSGHPVSTASVSLDHHDKPQRCRDACSTELGARRRGKEIEPSSKHKDRTPSTCGSRRRSDLERSNAKHGVSSKIGACKMGLVDVVREEPRRLSLNERIEQAFKSSNDQQRQHHKSSNSRTRDVGGSHLPHADKKTALEDKKLRGCAVQSSRQRNEPHMTRSVNYQQTQVPTVMTPTVSRNSSVPDKASLPKGAPPSDSRRTATDGQSCNVANPTPPSPPPRVFSFPQNSNVVATEVEQPSNSQTSHSLPASAKPTNEHLNRRRRELPPLKSGHIIVYSKTIFVGHLPKTINETAITNVFEQFGPISNIIHIQSKGCAFVSFKHRRHAVKCVERMHRDSKINGSTIKLSWAINLGIKDKYKDPTWCPSYGCTYIPVDEHLHSLTKVELQKLEQGGKIDLDTLPSAILEKLNKTEVLCDAALPVCANETSLSPIAPPSLMSVPPTPANQIIRQSQQPPHSMECEKSTNLTNDYNAQQYPSQVNLRPPVPMAATCLSTIPNANHDYSRIACNAIIEPSPSFDPANIHPPSQNPRVLPQTHTGIADMPTPWSNIPASVQGQMYPNSEFPCANNTQYVSSSSPFCANRPPPPHNASTTGSYQLDHPPREMFLANTSTQGNYSNQATIKVPTQPTANKADAVKDVPLVEFCPVDKEQYRIKESFPTHIATLAPIPEQRFLPVQDQGVAFFADGQYSGQVVQSNCLTEWDARNSLLPLPPVQTNELFQHSTGVHHDPSVKMCFSS